MFRNTIPSQVAILLPLLMVVALTQVLPQVDLPDTAFHENSAPVATKSCSVAAPNLSVTVRHDLTSGPRTVLAAVVEESRTPPHRARQSLPILFSAILC
jgi:hypothetical protein